MLIIINVGGCDNASPMTDTALFLCFMFHRTWEIQETRTLVESLGGVLELNCVCVCPDALLRTFILIPHHTCGGHQLENNSVATATQNQLSHAVLSVMLLCQAEGGVSTVDFLDSLKMF